MSSRDAFVQLVADAGSIQAMNRTATVERVSHDLMKDKDKDQEADILVIDSWNILNRAGDGLGPEEALGTATFDARCKEAGWKPAEPSGGWDIWFSGMNGKPANQQATGGMPMACDAVDDGPEYLDCYPFDPHGNVSHFSSPVPGKIVVNVLPGDWHGAPTTAQASARRICDQQ